MLVEQAVVRVGQRTAGREADRGPARQNRREARVLGQQEVAAERFMRQSVDGDRAQAVPLGLQQPDCAAAEMSANGIDQVLQPDSLRRFGDEVGHEIGDRESCFHGEKYLVRGGKDHRMIR